MSDMGIKTGKAFQDYVRPVSNKRKLDRQRKPNKTFKKQRRLLQACRIKGNRVKEEKELCMEQESLRTRVV